MKNVTHYTSLKHTPLYISLIIILVIIAGDPLDQSQITSVQQAYSNLSNSYYNRQKGIL